MGYGPCTLCSCPGWDPSSGGRTCINLNAEGGTCNHYFSEHSDLLSTEQKQELTNRGHKLVEKDDRVGTCAGNACAVASVDYDPSNGHYIGTNHSPNRRIRVDISNGFITEHLDLSPGQSKETALLKGMFVDPYHANYV